MDFKNPILNWRKYEYIFLPPVELQISVIWDWLQLGQIARTSNSEVCIAWAERRHCRAGEPNTVLLPETDHRTIIIIIIIIISYLNFMSMSRFLMPLVTILTLWLGTSFMVPWYQWTDGAGNPEIFSVFKMKYFESKQANSVQISGLASLNSSVDFLAQSADLSQRIWAESSSCEPEMGENLLMEAPIWTHWEKPGWRWRREYLCLSGEAGQVFMFRLRCGYSGWEQ